MSMVHGCNDDDNGKLKYSEKNLATFSQHKSSIDRPGSNPGFSEERSASNHLNHGTAHRGLKW
jgi:hypothetical protein